MNRFLFKRKLGRLSIFCSALLFSVSLAFAFPASACIKKPSFYYATASNGMNVSAGCDAAAVTNIMNDSFWEICLRDLSKIEPAYSSTITSKDMEKSFVHTGNIYYYGELTYVSRYQTADRSCPIISCITVVSFRLQTQLNAIYHFNGGYYVKDTKRIFFFDSNPYASISLATGIFSSILFSIFAYCYFNQYFSLDSKHRLLSENVTNFIEI